MDNTPPPAETKPPTAEPPAPEALVPRADDVAVTSTPANQPEAAEKITKRLRRNSYRPGHKGMFIGLAVVVLILAVNAGIIAFVIKAQSKNKSLASQNQVTINQGALDKLGVNQSSLGDAGVLLSVGPDTKFGGQVQVAGNVDIAGQLKLNNKFLAPDASFNQLEAGNTSLSQLNVNGDGNFNNVNLRNNLLVSGQTRLQGAVTVTQLLTVSNSVNVSGNLAVGGVLSTNGLSVHSLSIDSTLSIGGHVITRGSTPNVGPGGGALGSNGTVSISGNDSAGTISINIGAGAGTGDLARVAFRNLYGGAPHVVITPVGIGGNFYLSSISSAGFNVATASALPPGGFTIQYIVEQ